VGLAWQKEGNRGCGKLASHNSTRKRRLQLTVPRQAPLQDDPSQFNIFVFLSEFASCVMTSQTERLRQQRGDKGANGMTDRRDGRRGDDEAMVQIGVAK
jgi:hypothetical protein